MAQKTGLILSAYNSEWPKEFRIERKFLLSLFSANLKTHVVQIGSTAVEGLISRPIIDIAIGVENPLDLVTVRDILVNHKYLYSPSGSSIEHFVMGKRANGKIRFIIHVVKYNGTIYRDMGNFIKHLKGSISLVNQYGALKSHLLQNKVDMKEYSLEKRQFIKKYLSY